MVCIIPGQTIEVFEDKDKEGNSFTIANLYQSRAENPDLKKPQTIPVKFYPGFVVPEVGKPAKIKVSVSSWAMGTKNGMTCTAIK